MNNEPVAWTIKTGNDYIEFHTDLKEFQETVDFYKMEEWDFEEVPLYTHPVKEHDIGISHAIGFDDGFKAGMQRAVEMNVVKELTDEEIRHIQAMCHLKNVGYDTFIMRFARAIEEAHGIGE